MADTWTMLSGYTPSDYVDTMVFEVVSATKKIKPLSGQTLVAGEKNSQYVRFEMDRFWDGIDISAKNFSITYSLAGKYYGTSEAVSAEVSTDRLRFGWIVPEEACCIAGTLMFVLVIKSDGYVLKTQIAETPVVKSLDEESVVPEPTREAWYKEFQARVQADLDASQAALTSAQDALTRANTANDAASSALTAASEANLAAQDAIVVAKERYGSPLVANAGPEMVDTNRVYVFTGSESAYTYGHWYYYDNGVWNDGGVYNGNGVNTDKTLSIENMPADAKKTGYEINELKEGFTALNLTTLSGIEATYGYPLGSKKWGNVNSTYQHKVIPVQGGEKIVIEAKNLPSGYLLYYGALTSYSIPAVDDNVNYSSDSDWSDRRTVDKSYTIVDTIPNDARYIFIEVVYGGVSTLPSKLEIGGYDYSKSTAVEAVTANNQDLVPIKWVQGTINATTGANVNMNNRLRSHNTFYDVSSGIKFTVPSGYKFEAFYYSANGGGYVTYHDFDTTEEVYVYPRNDAKYCRFVCAKTDDTTITTTEVYAEYISNGTLPKWYALGDSITQGYFSYINGSNVAAYKTFSNGYVSHIAYKGGLALINCGIGGSGYVRAGSVLSQYNARQNVDSIDFSDADLVTLAYGLNDWKYNQNLGTFDDDVETGGTIYSNMRYCIEKILSDNPQCKIIIIPPFNCSAYGAQATNWGLGHSFSNNGTLEQIYTALKTVAEYYGVEIIDTTHTSVINRITAPSLLIDGTHPSAKCHAILGAELTKKINYV